MLSTVPIKDSNGAASYYEKDNYYTKGSPESVEASHWWGKGAAALKLSGYVEIQDLKECLDGNLPNGEKLGWTEEQFKKYQEARKENPNLPKRSAHRPGYDFTFSAPKSVSLLAELGKDKRIHVAHQKAVDEAVGYLEQAAAQTRRAVNGRIVFERTGNLAVSMFRHDTAREARSGLGPDPDLHTHCVIMNATQRADGKWTSISSELLFDHKMTAGMVYRSKLAVELQKIGYRIVQKHSDGRFDIVGVSEEAIKHFSQRRQEIEAELTKKGWEGAKAASVVTKDSRQKKEDVDRESLHATWEDRAQAISFEHGKIIEQAITRAKSKAFRLVSPGDVASKSVRYAISHLTEREAVFPDHDLIKESLAHALGSTTVKHVAEAITKVFKAGELISVGNDKWTTKEMIALEKDNIALMKTGQGTVKPITSKKVLQEYMDHRDFTKGQQEAIEMTMTTTDRVVGIQGYAGTGKTTMLKAVNEIATKSGYSLIGIAPTKNAANLIEEKAGIESKTLHKYLIDMDKLGKRVEKRALLEKPLLIVLDEASMASSQHINRLLSHGHNERTRLLIVGDRQQLASPEAGKPYDQLLSAGMQTAVMKDILRQNDNDLKNVVYSTIEGKIQLAFQKLSGNIHEISDKNKRLGRIAREYLDYSQDGRTRVMVLIPANDDRVKVNHLIREGLKKEDALSGEEAKTEILVSRGFSKTYCERVTNYDIGDTVRFNRTYKSLNIKAGEYFTVDKIAGNRNEMVLKSEEKTIVWNPALVGGRRNGAVEVYQKEERGLMKGDIIRWRRNFDDGRVNAQLATVTNVSKNIATIKLRNRRTLQLDVNQDRNKHWDYSFSCTVHAKQGDSCEYVIAHMESFRAMLTTLSSFYVTISRAIQSAHLFVDDKKACAETIEKNTGQKISALESLEKVSAWEKLLAKEQQTNELKQLRQQEAKHNNYSLPLEPKSSKNYQQDLNIICNDLNLNVERIARTVVNDRDFNPKLSKENKCLVWGKKGSLKVNVSGPKAGEWYDFEGAQGGGMLQLIQVQTGLDFKGALQYAKDLLGWTEKDHTNRKIERIPKPSSPKYSRSNNIPDASDLKAIANAQKMARLSVPIKDTAAEKYLREHRGIRGKIPDDVRFHPRVYEPETRKEQAAMLVVARNKDGEIQAVQATYLNKTTAKKLDVKVQKRTFGRPRFGAAVNLNPKAKGDLMITEGVEDGLSIMQAMPDKQIKVACSVSNFKNIKPDSGQRVVFCNDNDGVEASSKKSVQTAATALVKGGYQVFTTEPKEVKDFNDLLRKEGVGAVKSQLAEVKSFKIREIQQVPLIHNANVPVSVSSTLKKDPLTIDRSNAQKTTKSLHDVIHSGRPQQKQKDKDIER